MPSQIRPSSLVLAVLMSVGLVVGSIVLRPPLTRTLYIQYAALIAGAGLIVTLYNYFLTLRVRRRAQQDAKEIIPPLSPSELPMPPPQEADTAADPPCAYAATTETVLPEASFPAAAAHPLPAEERDAAPAVRRDPAQSTPPQEAEDLPENMDALLDVAYEAAEDNPLRAVAAYRRALARYPDDSYVPYLIIELTTLYKRFGDYEAALALFDEACALPVIAKNAVMVQEFERSRRALTVVSHMLRAQGTPALPFGEVSKELLAEADRRAQELTT